MGVHPARWLRGGALFGSTRPRRNVCGDCSIPLPPRWSAPYCATCIANHEDDDEDDGPDH